MRLDLRNYWPLLVVPTVFWLAMFSCANPPPPEPLAPRLIQYDWTAVDDLGPLEWSAPLMDLSLLEFQLPPVELIEKGEAE